MVAGFQSKQHNEDDIAESDGDKYHADSITLEELFPDLEDEMDSSEVDKFDIYVGKITKKHLSVGSVQVVSYIRYN